MLNFGKSPRFICSIVLILAFVGLFLPQRRKRGILRAMDLEKVKTSDVDEATRKHVKAYGVHVTEKVPTMVDRVFGGKLTSHVRCDECNTVSKHYYRWYET